MSGGADRARAVICDFGGVLTTPLAAAFVAWQEASGVSLEELGRAVDEATAVAGGRHPLHELETDRIDEAEFLGRIEAALGRDGSLASFADIYFGSLRRNPEMIEYMRRLRERGLRMALLTNNVREWEPRWRAMLPEIDEIFEVVVDSAYVGVRKPDPEIYRLTLERLGGGVRAEDCVFVDDVEPNCEAAGELGMRAVHFIESGEAIVAIEAALR